MLARQGLSRMSQITLLLMIAAALAMAAAIGAGIWQRRASLASLRIHSFTPWQLRAVLTFESVLVLGTGGLVGALAGIYGHLLCDRYLRLTTGFPGAVRRGRPSHDPDDPVDRRRRARRARHPWVCGLAGAAPTCTAGVEHWASWSVSSAFSYEHGGMNFKGTSVVAEIIAFVTAGVVYWLTIYPRARFEIRRWAARAGQIPDPTLRAQALFKLTRERLNPEAAAFFAVLAPRRHRATLVRLMVGFQIAYDYLDAINEEPETAVLRNGLQLHRALSDAVSSRASGCDYYRHHPQRDDGGYLAALVGACQDALLALPSASAIESLLIHAAERCGEAQSRNHALLVEGDGQLIDWTRHLGESDEYLWWELAAAGISCLALHALFAAAACATTLEQAAQIDMAYFPSVCAISALLDSLVDQSADSAGTNHSFVAHYESSAVAARRFAAITSEARARSRVLTHHHRHGVILAGIASFYLSAPEASSERALPVATRTLDCLGRSSAPILAVMRLRRRSVG